MAEYDEDEDDEEIDDAYPFMNNLPRQISCPNDPRRNLLSFDEWRFLCQIQNTFTAATSATDVANNDDHDENGFDLDMPSDYMLCQLAIHCRGSVGGETEAVQKARGMQRFRERYGIRDNCEEGCRAIHDLIELLPRLYLHHGFSPEEGTYVLVVDMACFDTTVLNTEKRYNQFMIGEYYLLQAMNCDFATMRLGPEGIFDCIDVGWTMKADFKILKDLFRQLISFYPASPVVRHRNVGVIFNLLFSTAKKVLPSKIRDKFDFAHASSDGALRNVFMVPTVQDANLRVVASLQAALKRRYENERNLSLF